MEVIRNLIIVYLHVVHSSTCPMYVNINCIHLCMLVVASTCRKFDSLGDSRKASLILQVFQLHSSFMVSKLKPYNISCYRSIYVLDVHFGYLIWSIQDIFVQVLQQFSYFDKTKWCIHVD